MALVSPPVVLGQETQDTTSQTPAEASEPEPIISPADFLEEEERAQARVDSVERLLLPNADVQRVVDDLTTLTATLARLRQRPEVVNPDRYPIRRIVNLRAEWIGYAADLEDWQETLNRRLRDLEQARTDLTDLEARALSTDSAIAARGGSELIRVRMSALSEKIEDVRTRIAGAIDGTLAVQERLVIEGARIGDQIGVFDARFRQVQRELLVTESPPLWSVVSSGHILSPSRTRGETFQDNVAAVRTFAADNRTKLLFQLAFTAFLAVALIMSGARTRSLGGVEALKGPMHALAHPVSTALISGLLLTIPLYPTAPEEIREIAVLLSIPPVMALLHRLLGRGMRAALHFTAAMVVLDLIASNLDWVPSLGRLILLAETLLGIAGFVWLLRQGSPARPKHPSKWWSAVRVGARASGGLLVVSALANVVGNRSLAELLTSGVVRSTYLGVVLVVGALIARGLVALLPRTRVGQSLRGVRRHADVVVHKLQWQVDVVFVLVWLVLTARLFAVADGVAEWLRATLGRVVHIGSLAVAPAAVLLFLFSVWLTFKISQGVRFILNEEVLDRLDLPRGMGSTVSTVTHYTILTGGVFVALMVAGIDISRLTLIAGALGVGIGFGLQGLVNNFVSGLILIFERPMAVGDTVALGTVTGKVQRIGMRSTTVLTFDGAEVIVPNGNLIANDLVNWTLSDRKRRVEVDIGAAYGSDPEQVIRVLRQASEEHDEILTFPEPIVVFLGFGDSALNFSLRAWVRTFEDHFRVRSELTRAVYEAFQREGIEIPFPQRDLHLKSGDPAQGEIFGTEDGVVATVKSDPVTLGEQQSVETEQVGD